MIYERGDDQMSKPIKPHVMLTWIMPPIIHQRLTRAGSFPPRLATDRNGETDDKGGTIQEDDILAGVTMGAMAPLDVEDQFKLEASGCPVDAEAEWQLQVHPSLSMVPCVMVIVEVTVSAPPAVLLMSHGCCHIVLLVWFQCTYAV